MKRGDVSELESQINNLENEVRDLEKSFMLKDLKKFRESKDNIALIQRKIKVLTK